MEPLLAAVVGALFGAGIYLLLRRSLIRIVVGLVLLGQATNLLIFVAGSVAPLSPASDAVAGDASRLTGDPLPQALVLTAIVINFGMLAFALVLARRLQDVAGTDDPDATRDDAATPADGTRPS